MYTEKVKDHFQNPRNVGEIPDADGIGTAGNPADGDLIKIYIKVNNKKISEIRFRTYGCVAAIATSSMVTEIARGKSIEEAMKITRKQTLFFRKEKCLYPQKKLFLDEFIEGSTLLKPLFD